MDLKKEIKLSDLFRRKPKDPAEPEVTAPPEEKPKKERSSFFTLRKRKDGAEDAAPAEPKQPKERRRKEKKDKKAAPALPQVPLMRAFNLLPREEGRRESVTSEEDGRKPSTPQLVLAVVGLLLVAALASIFLITNATVADKQAELDGLRSELAALNEAAEKPSAPEPDGTLVQERNNRTGALATALGQRVAWDRLLRELSLVLPDDVWLTRLTAKAGGAGALDPNAPPDPNAAPPASTFEIGGYTRKQEHVAQLLSRMGVLPQVASVQLLGATATKIGEEDVIEFTISATMKAAGAGGTS